MSVETQITVSILVNLMYLCFFVLSIAGTNGQKLFSPLNRIFICYIFHNIALLASCILDYTRDSALLQYIACMVYPVTGFLALYYYGCYFAETCEAPEKSVLRINRFNKIILWLNFLCTLPLIPSGRFFSVTKDCIYIRGDLFFLSYTFVSLELLVLSLYALVALKNRKKAIGYVFFGIFPLFVSTLLIFFSIASPLIDFSTVISCLILYSLVYLEDRKKALENETKLAKYKTDIMLSQIGPHFIYNTLSTISALCTVDPQRAQALSADFTDYLRNELNLAKSERLSSFEEELNHTKKYLEIEKVRFGKRLNVVYDIRETQFKLPSLSLQPLVENAVKHGIMQKQHGGTVTIATEKRDNQIAVTVSDDGVGFDLSQYVPKEGHYGIANTKERLEILLGGEMTVESIPNGGTTVTMLVKQPKNEKETVRHG